MKLLNWYSKDEIDDISDLIEDKGIFANMQGSYIQIHYIEYKDQEYVIVRIKDNNPSKKNFSNGNGDSTKPKGFSHEISKEAFIKQINDNLGTSFDNIHDMEDDKDIEYNIGVYEIPSSLIDNYGEDLQDFMDTLLDEFKNLGYEVIDM